VNRIENLTKTERLSIQQTMHDDNVYRVQTSIGYYLCTFGLDTLS